MDETIRILVVDDEKFMRVTLADILVDEGYRVDVADCGEAAVEMCAETRYDAILMDVRMPGIDGVEAFRLIRRHQHDARVILMSAYPVEELKRAVLEEGAIAFLAKPLDVEKVVKLIQETQQAAILVVANDAATLNLLGDGLKEQGYRVATAHSPEEAMALVEQIGFDLVFLDAVLPAMNGLDLYLAIKKVTPAVTAIMMAGFDRQDAEVAREAVRKSAYTVLEKPLDLDSVLALLKRIASQRVTGELRKPSTNFF
ncbi:MAG: response regulator [Pirellulales bacterium]